MTHAELTSFSQKHTNILWQDDVKGSVLFRNENLDWYKNRPEDATAITYDKLDTMTEDDVLAAIDKGLSLKHISRVTGYFSVIEQWNPGKRAELRDRRKTDLAGNPQRITLPELSDIQAGLCEAG